MYPQYQIKPPQITGTTNALALQYKPHVQEVQPLNSYNMDAINLDYLLCFMQPEDFIERRP